MRLQTALRAIYPAECLVCSEQVDSEFALCPSCWSETPFIHGTVCDLCGVPLPGSAEPDSTLICDDCQEQPRNWRQGRSVLLYRGLGRKLSLSLKHGDRAEIARAAGPWLARAAAQMLTDDAANAIIVPIPLHRFRLLKRRFNQSALLAQAFAQSLGAELCVDALERVIPTPSLDGQSREDRFATLKNSIRPHPKRGQTLRDKTVLLVDDVMTTGATFAAATDAAYLAGAKNVCVIALARVASDT